MLENFANNAQTVLASAVTSPTSSLTVDASTTGFPAAPFRVRLGDELLLVTGVSGSTWTLAAATAAAHAAGDTVTHLLSAEGLLSLADRATLTPGGRLTLNSTETVGADVTGGSTLYYLPHDTSKVPVWNGTRDELLDIGSGGLSIGTSGLAAFVNYDVFVYSNAGTPALELQPWRNANCSISNASPAVVTWSGHGLANGDPVTFTTTGSLPSGLSAGTQYWVRNATGTTFQLASSKPTGSLVNTSSNGSGTHSAYDSKSRAATLSRVRGIERKGADDTRTFIGIVRTDASAVFADSAAKRFVWNRYCQVSRLLQKSDFTSHNYGTNSWREWADDIVARAAFVYGFAQVAVAHSHWAAVTNAAGGYGYTGALVNGSNPGNHQQGVTSGTLAYQLGIGQASKTVLGYNYLTVYETTQGTGSVSLAACSNAASLLC